MDGEKKKKKKKKKKSKKTLDASGLAKSSDGKKPDKKEYKGL